MAEELTIEIPQPKKKPLLRNARNMAILIFIALVIFAGIYSWWLSQGKIASVSARLDTVVYTVEPDYTTRLASLDVKVGDTVSAGQTLGRLDMEVYLRKLEATRSNLRGMQPDSRVIAERLAKAQAYEKQVSEKLAQAQAHEQRMREILQDCVTDHVRAQLAMRSLPAHGEAYARAKRAVEEAQARMEKARADFEEASKIRAVVLVELGKLKADIMRRRFTDDGANGKGQPAWQPPNLGNGELYSPVAGRILRINSPVGKTVYASEPLFVILPTARNEASDLWIQAWFPLEDQKKIELGQKVSIRFEKNGLHINGRIAAISAEAQNLPAVNTGMRPTSMEAAQAGETPAYTDKRYLPVRIVPDDAATLAGLDPGEEAQCQIQTRYILGSSLF